MICTLHQIFRPKRDKVTVQWRELHNEEHNDLYPSPNIIRMIKLGRIGEACSRYGGQ